MTLENSIRLLAGTLILISLALSRVHSEYWLWVTAFVGFNLFQSSLTKFCPAEIIFSKLFFKNRPTT